MSDEFVEADLKNDMAVLAKLLGDTRVRFHHRETQLASWQQLIDVDLQIRLALARPLSAELQFEILRLTARLRTLDLR